MMQHFFMVRHLPQPRVSVKSRPSLLFIGLALSLVRCQCGDALGQLPSTGAGDDDVQPRTGTVVGRICATEAGLTSGTEYWLPGARVFVEVGETVYEERTDADGYFVLADMPVGTRTLQVTKGSFSASREVQVRDGEVTDIGFLCVAPSVQIAVITGLYDQVEMVLADMGFGVRDCISDAPAFCPAELDPNGTVTLVDGSGGDYLTLLLSSWYEIQQFDILFFNCGMWTQGICSAPPGVVVNLQDFVARGGSIYVSDRAYEILRVVFAGLIAFANETEFVSGPDWPDTPGCEPADQQAAWVGMMTTGLYSTVISTPLVEALDAGSVALAYDKGGWVPLAVAQPAEVSAWMTADVRVDLDDNDIPDAVLTAAPVLVSVPHGDGKIIYTTFHTHQQANAEMMAILRHIVFEL